MCSAARGAPANDDARLPSPGKEYYTTWFDTWRFVNGKADEHWDPATIAAPVAPAAR